MKRTNRVSVYTVFANIPTYIYTAAIPILQNYLFDPKGAMQIIISNALNIVLMAAALTLSAADYSRKKLRFTDDCISVSQGTLVRSFFKLPYDKIRSLTFTSSPMMKLFSAVKLTAGPGRAGAFYISEDAAKSLAEEFSIGFGGICCREKVSNRKILRMSALSANPLAGLTVAVPLFGIIGRAFGSGARKELLHRLDFSRYFLYLGLSKGAAVIAWVMAVLYVIGAVTVFLKNACLEYEICEKGTIVRSGILIRQEVYFTHDDYDNFKIFRYGRQAASPGTHT